MKKKLVFILSSNYSGPHFLSLMLGSNSKAEHLGELKNLVKQEGGCQVCESPESCELFYGIKQLPRSELYPILFSRVSQNIEMLVDASKKPKWFKQFIDDKCYDIRLIHLVRDPRALARRWLMRFDERQISSRERLKQIRNNPLSGFKILFSGMLNVSMYKWYSQNREIADFIENSGRPSMVVTYKELAVEPDKTLGDLSKFLGVDYEPSQKEYWSFPHHGTEKQQYKWIGKEKDNSYFDTRWKKFLDAEQVVFIEEHKVVKKLLSRLNLKMSEDGLTQQV